MNDVIGILRSVEFNSDGTPIFLDTGEGASEHIRTWSDWRTYISNLNEDVISDHGIARLTCEFIEGTSDANRGGARRCDIVVYTADGCFCRLHPGGKGQDATPTHFKPDVLAPQVLQSTEPIEWVAAELRSDVVPIPFTRAHCRCVPQIDRMSKKDVWEWVQSLGALEHSWHEFEIGGDTGFKWWLWLPTLVDSGHIAADVEKVRIRADGQTFARFTFTHPDGEVTEIDLSPHRNGSIRCSRARGP